MTIVAMVAGIGIDQMVVVLDYANHVLGTILMDALAKV